MAVLSRLRVDGMNSNLEHSFFYHYFRALLFAAVAFGLVHGGQVLVVGLIKNNFLSIKLSAIFDLFVFEILQSLIFMIIGLAMGHIPLRILCIAIRNSSDSKRYLISAITGSLLGILFLPLCACFSFFLLHEPGDPGYVARCAEFAFPMIVAGGFGGYSFWRFGGENLR